MQVQNGVGCDETTHITKATPSLWRLRETTMDFYPYGTRALIRGRKAHTVLDTVARHFLPYPVPLCRAPGKLRKDDQSCKSVKDYLEEKYVYDHRMNRKGRYEPRQIVRNFWRV
jgi:hypothetical protein